MTQSYSCKSEISTLEANGSLEILYISTTHSIDIQYKAKRRTKMLSDTITMIECSLRIIQLILERMKVLDVRERNTDILKEMLQN